MSGLVVDLFAGGGGASVGLEAALGRSVDIAINHDATAMDVHKANHPDTRHLEANIWEVRPLEATLGLPVDVLWASPDCTHFSVAKGGQPRQKNIRSLAWAVVKWAATVKPRLIFLENVAEFRTWGPLDETGRPIQAKKGIEFRAWLGTLQRLGYDVDYRVLDASLYGAPTKRKRLFLVARRDGLPIVWPEPTHGPGRKPLHTAAECIDWSIPCPSIFERKRPLAEKTLWRIAEGLRRFVLDNPEPYIVTIDQQSGTRAESSINSPIATTTTKNRHAVVTPALFKVNHSGEEARGESIEEPVSTVTASRRGHAIIAPTLVQTGYGERQGQAARVLDLEAPIGTLVAGQKHGLVSAFLAKHFSDRSGGFVGGQRLDEPTGTLTTRDHNAPVAATLVKFRGDNAGADPTSPVPVIAAGGMHIAEVRAFLTAFYGTDGTPGKGQRLDQPARTITARHRLGLVTISGVDYQIVDIGMRMLEPHELLRAQFGRFAESYDLSAAKTKSAKVRLIGNSVCPEVAEAIVNANVPKRARAVA